MGPIAFHLFGLKLLETLKISSLTHNSLKEYENVVNILEKHGFEVECLMKNRTFADIIIRKNNEYIISYTTLHHRAAEKGLEFDSFKEKLDNLIATSSKINGDNNV